MPGIPDAAPELKARAIPDRIPAWIGRAKDLTSIVTISGITAALYALGYVAASRRAETLGVPDTTEGPGAYWRTGYFCVVDTLAGLGAAIVSNWLVTAAIVAGATAAVWAVYQIRLTRRERRLLVLFISAAYVMLLAGLAQTAASIRAMFKATGLLIRSDDELRQLPAQARVVIDALANNNTDVLHALYNQMVWRTAVALLLLTAILLCAHRVRKPLVRYGRWIVAIALVAQASLLPFLYGVCYLTTTPSCVRIATVPEDAQKMKAAGGEEFVNVTGYLISTIDSKAETIQVFAVKSAVPAPPSLHLVPRAKVNAIRFLNEANCGTWLPGFRTASR